MSFKATCQIYDGVLADVACVEPQTFKRAITIEHFLPQLTALAASTKVVMRKVKFFQIPIQL